MNQHPVKVMVHVGLLFNEPPGCAGMQFDKSTFNRSYEQSLRCATLIEDSVLSYKGIRIPFFLGSIIPVYQFIDCYFASRTSKITTLALVNDFCMLSMNKVSDD